MTQSAIERFLFLKAKGLRFFWIGRDRGVLIGLLFSAIPLPPAFLLGWLVDLIHLHLLRTRRLSAREKPLVLISTVLALLNTVLRAWIAHQIWATTSTFSPLTLWSLLAHAQAWISWIFQPHAKVSL